MTTESITQMRRLLLTAAVGAALVAPATAEAATTTATVAPPPTSLRSLAASQGFTTYKGGVAWPLTNADVPVVYVFRGRYRDRLLLALRMRNSRAAFLYAAQVRNSTTWRQSAERTWSKAFGPSRIIKAESWRKYALLTLRKVS
jgi:hypothetical protein